MKIAHPPEPTLAARPSFFAPGDPGTFEALLRAPATSDASPSLPPTAGKGVEAGSKVLERRPSHAQAAATAFPPQAKADSQSKAAKVEPPATPAQPREAYAVALPASVSAASSFPSAPTAALGFDDLGVFVAEPSLPHAPANPLGWVTPPVIEVQVATTEIGGLSPSPTRLDAQATAPAGSHADLVRDPRDAVPPRGSAATPIAAVGFDELGVFGLARSVGHASAPVITIAGAPPHHTARQTPVDADLPAPVHPSSPQALGSAPPFGTDAFAARMRPDVARRPVGSTPSAQAQPIDPTPPIRRPAARKADRIDARPVPAPPLPPTRPPAVTSTAQVTIGQTQDGLHLVARTTSAEASTSILRRVLGLARREGATLASATINGRSLIPQPLKTWISQWP